MVSSIKLLYIDRHLYTSGSINVSHIKRSLNFEEIDEQIWVKFLQSFHKKPKSKNLENTGLTLQRLVPG